MTKQTLTALPPKPQAPAKDPQGAATASKGVPKAPNPDEFVKGPGGASAPSLAPTPIEAEEPVQRLTLEIPLSLHRLIKSGCAERGTKIKAEVLALLESHYRPEVNA
jgi:hypothetical protein